MSFWNLLIQYLSYPLELFAGHVINKNVEKWALKVKRVKIDFSLNNTKSITPSFKCVRAKS